MDRRKALQTIGVLAICALGKQTIADTVVTQKSTGDNSPNIVSNGNVSLSFEDGAYFTDKFSVNPKTSIVLAEDAIDKIIIETSDGPDITIPFSDVVEALRGI